MHQRSTGTFALRVHPLTFTPSPLYHLQPHVRLLLVLRPPPVVLHAHKRHSSTYCPPLALSKHAPHVLTSPSAVALLLHPSCAASPPSPSHATAAARCSRRFRHAAPTTCIILLQLFAGGVMHRVWRQQTVCAPAAASASRFIPLALLTPLKEELLYRGLVPAIFLHRVPSPSRAVSILFPALLFAAAHVGDSPVDLPAAVHHLAFGCCVGARACAADSTWHAVLIHAANNAVVACASGAPAASDGGGSLAAATAAYAACACADLLHMFHPWRAGSK